MIILKTGSWCNINGTRMLTTKITPNHLYGVTFDFNGVIHDLHFDLADIYSASRSRKPPQVNEKQTKNLPQNFGLAYFNLEDKKIVKIKIIQDDVSTVIDIKKGD